MNERTKDRNTNDKYSHTQRTAKESVFIDGWLPDRDRESPAHWLHLQ